MKKNLFNSKHYFIALFKEKTKNHLFSLEMRGIVALSSN